MRIVIRKSTIYYILMIILLFQSGLRVVTTSNLVDDCCVLVMLALLIYNNGCIRRLIKPFSKIFLTVFAIITVGLASSGIHRLQPISVVLNDMYTCFRFLFALLTGALMARKVKNAENKIKVISELTIVTLTVLTFINLFVFPVFKTYETRLIPCQRLFFENPAEFSTIVIVCMIVYIYCGSGNKKMLFYLFCGSFCVFSTMRSKAIGMVVAIWLIYLLLVKKVIHSKFIIALFILSAVFFVGAGAFENYYLDLNQPRAVLLMTSIRIATDYLPLGAGFGTFGSHASRVSYSPLYNDYGLSGIYGLSKETGSYITDQMWGTVIAQFGYIGGILFVMLLLQMYKCINRYTIFSKNAYAASLLLFIYIIILSLAESSLFNPSALTIFYLFGFFIYNNYSLYKESYYKLHKCAVCKM